LDGGKWEPECALKGGSISIEWEIFVFAERRSYEGWCGGAIVAVYPASMLFDGGSNRRALAVLLVGILALSLDL